MVVKSLSGALIACGLFCACGQHLDKSQLAANEVLFNRADSFIVKTVDQVHGAFNSRLQDPEWSSSARAWRPAVEEVMSQTRLLNDRIKSVALEAKQLHNQVVAYRKSIEAAFDSVLADRPGYLKRDFKDMIGRLTLWEDSNMPGADIEITPELLRKLQIDLHLTTYKLVLFCLQEIDSRWRKHHEWPELLIGLDNGHVVAGESIALYAGVGYFSGASNPKISIDGSKVKVVDGLAKDTILASKQPGKHRVKVHIELTKPDGSIGIYEKQLTYTTVPVR